MRLYLYVYKDGVIARRSRTHLPERERYKLADERGVPQEVLVAKGYWKTVRAGDVFDRDREAWHALREPL